MSNSQCSCRYNCLTLSVIASAILGVVATVLTITGVISSTPAFLWVVFGIAVVYLAITAVISIFSNRACLCNILPTLLTGILGTILTAVILLAIDFVATSIVGAIILGLLILFFSLTITATACLARCVSGCSVND